MKIKLSCTITHKVEDGRTQNGESKDIDTTELTIEEIQKKVMKHMKGFVDRIADQLDGFKISSEDLNDFF